MNKKVTIIDYGAGNILSVSQAIEHCGAETILSANPEEILKSDYVILPGVGAYGKAMDQLNDKNLKECILEYAKTERPFLGICLGMQMMLDSSEEFGKNEGVGLIPGQVKAIPGTTTTNQPHKIPHIGWTPIEELEQNWDNTILKGIPNRTPFYFVHSFTAHPENEENRLADSYYNGRRIAATVFNKNMYGCQFHPEKSGEFGLKILKNFLSL